MAQQENKEVLLRLLNTVKGYPQTLEQVTSQWDIDPNISFIHHTELSGKVISYGAISINDYYPLVQYPLGEKLDTRATAKA